MDSKDSEEAEFLEPEQEAKFAHDDAVCIYIYSFEPEVFVCNKDVFFKNFGHGFIILKLVEITGNDNGMVVFSGDVHLRFERYVTRWFLGNDQLNAGHMPERYFRCNDQLMSCPFPVPICERLAFNVFPCHTSLFLEPCEWQESHMNLISRVFNHSNGTRIHNWVCQEVSNYIEEWKEEAGGANEQMSRPHSTTSFASLTCSWFGMGNFHEEALLWQLVTHAIQPLCTKIGRTLPVPVLYLFILHTSCSSIWMQADLPAFPCYPGSWKFYGRFLAFKAWVLRTWSDFFLHLVCLVEDCHMFV